MNNDNEATIFSNEMLSEAIRKFMCIYDKSDPNHKNKEILSMQTNVLSCRLQNSEYLDPMTMFVYFGNEATPLR